MKHLILLSLITITIAGCGEKIRKPTSDATLRQYAQDVAEDSPVQMRLDYSIYFVDEIEDNVIGRCKIINGKPFSIIIKRSWWENSNEVARYALMTHEMVHCSLQLGHIVSGVPTADKLMSKTIDGAIQCIINSDIGPCIQQSIDLYYTGKIGPIGTNSKNNNKCDHKH